MHATKDADIRYLFFNKIHKTLSDISSLPKKPVKKLNNIVNIKEILIMTYAEYRRQDLLNEGVHVNDDLANFGQISDEYDYEEHESYVEVAK